VGLIRILSASSCRRSACFCNGAFWLSILQTLLGYIPGIVHAVQVIAKR
jgi:uncharacterized membrane protein YqaE (UPF0057 family)